MNGDYALRPRLMLSSRLVQIQVFILFFGWSLALIMPKFLSDIILGCLLLLSIVAVFLSGLRYNLKSLVLIFSIILFIWFTVDALVYSAKTQRMYYVLLPSLFLVIFNHKEINRLLLNDSTIQYIALIVGAALLIKCYRVVGLDRLQWENAIGINVITVSRYALIVLVILQRNKFHSFLRGVALIVQFLLFILLLMAQTRGILFPLFLSFFFIGLGQYGYIKTSIVSIPIVLLLRFYLSARLGEFESVETISRVINIENGLNLFVEAPFCGYGVDNWTLFSDSPYPHNILIEVLVELGLIGGSMILYLYFGWFFKVRNWCSLTRIEIISFCLIFDSLVSGNLSMNIQPIIVSALGFL